MRYLLIVFRCYLVVLIAVALSSCASLQDQGSAETTEKVAPDVSASVVAETPPPVEAEEPPFTPEQQAELVSLPPPETDLWEVIVNGYSIPDVEGPRVEKWEDWYSNRPDYVERIFERSRLYLYHIVHEVQARNMPMEIALLPMIESGYNPNALSRSSASGIWQFIPSTGKNYGLKQNWWVDERRDVLSATDSALDYLQKLYGDFNDWQLALAAYNCGEGSVARAQAKNRARGLPETYEALRLTNETMNYVPKLQAIKNIIRDPEKYNLELSDMPDAPYFTVVKTRKRMDVSKAVALAEMSKEEFLALNPQHNRPVIAGADEFTLLLPIDKAELFASKLELEDQPLVTWQAYRLQKSESFAQVANKFGMSLEALRAVNGLGLRAHAREGVNVLVPAQQPSWTAETSLTQAVFTTVPSARTSRYKVKRGDTLAQIAHRYDTTPEELMRLNGLKNAKHLRVGKNIRVYNERARYDSVRASSVSAPRALSEKITDKPTDKSTDKATRIVAAPTTSATYHKVQKGDTPAKIASHYRINVQDLMRWNGLTSAKTLQVGQNLRVSADGQVSTTQASSSPKLSPIKTPATRHPISKTAYHKVEEGDTLYDIASRYNVSVDELKRWNGLKNAALRIGQTLRISGGVHTARR
ncbi:MAG: LysM peptidoglycan-binding domain-containing protein [Betaproteobacteria bacterium]|nr:LysM peptidoglycan-binding domain-containing protein [Betaproteobacteria bacterium]